MSSNKGPLPDFSALQAAIAPAEPETDSSTDGTDETVANSEPVVDVLPSFSLNTKPVKKPAAAKPEVKPEPVAKVAAKPTKTETIAVPDFAIKTPAPSKPVETKSTQPVVTVKPTETVVKPAATAVVQSPAKPVAKKQTGIAAEVAGLQDFAAAITGETKVASPAVPTVSIAAEPIAVAPTGVAAMTKDAKPAAVGAVAAPKSTPAKAKTIAVRGQQLTPVVADIAGGVAFAGAAAALYQGIDQGNVLAAIANVAMLIVAGAAMLSLGLIARLLIKLNDQQG